MTEHCPACAAPVRIASDDGPGEEVTNWYEPLGPPSDGRLRCSTCGAESVSCADCGKPVPPDRAAYAWAACLECLPPPPEQDAAVRLADEMGVEL